MEDINNKIIQSVLSTMPKSLFSLDDVRKLCKQMYGFTYDLDKLAALVRKYVYTHSPSFNPKFAIFNTVYFPPFNRNELIKEFNSAIFEYTCSDRSSVDQIRNMIRQSQSIKISTNYLICLLNNEGAKFEFRDQKIYVVSYKRSVPEETKMSTETETTEAPETNTNNNSADTLTTILKFVECFSDPNMKLNTREDALKMTNSIFNAFLKKE